MKPSYSLFLLLLPLTLFLPACNQLEQSVIALSSIGTTQAKASEHGSEEEHENHQHRLIATTVVAREVVSTQPYVCQIHSCRRIELKALETGYLEAIPIKEGQAVKQGDVLFKEVASLYQARLDADLAEAKLVQLELNNAKRLFEQRVVAQQEVALAEAKLLKAQARVKLAETELNFTEIKAPFSGIVDRLHAQQGSLVAEGDVLTTLSDNSVMWVYFNVPEARYLEYKANFQSQQDNLRVELVLADHSKFPVAGKIGAIEAEFNNETGNIAFRADFENPTGLLRHGQTGNVLISRVLKDAIVIPQRATFEILAKRYVYVIDENKIVHQREIEIQTVQDDIFVLSGGLVAGEKIILEGLRQVRDGDEVEVDFEDADQVLNHLKNKAE